MDKTPGAAPAVTSINEVPKKFKIVPQVNKIEKKDAIPKPRPQT
jgi:hypothetical protein